MDALAELAGLREDEIFEEVLDELNELCRYKWLLRLLLTICEQRDRA